MKYIMKNIHIENSYYIWDINRMRYLINKESLLKYRSISPTKLLNRNYFSMYVEWWIHNIGYYITNPLCFIPFFKSINNRFMHVDLEERSK